MNRKPTIYLEVFADYLRELPQHERYLQSKFKTCESFSYNKITLNDLKKSLINLVNDSLHSNDKFSNKLTKEEENGLKAIFDMILKTHSEKYKLKNRYRVNSITTNLLNWITNYINSYKSYQQDLEKEIAVSPLFKHRRENSNNNNSDNNSNDDISPISKSSNATDSTNKYSRQNIRHSQNSQNSQNDSESSYSENSDNNDLKHTHSLPNNLTSHRVKKKRKLKNNNNTNSDNMTVPNYSPHYSFTNPNTNRFERSNTVHSYVTLPHHNRENPPLMNPRINMPPPPNVQLNNMPPNNMNNMPPLNMGPTFQYRNIPNMTNIPPMQPQYGNGYRPYNPIPQFNKRHASLPFLGQPINNMRRRPPPNHPQTHVGLPPNINNLNPRDNDFKSPRYLSRNESPMNSQNTDTNSIKSSHSSQRQIVRRVKSKDTSTSSESNIISGKKTRRNTKLSRNTHKDIKKQRKEKQFPNEDKNVNFNFSDFCEKTSERIRKLEEQMLLLRKSNKQYETTVQYLKRENNMLTERVRVLENRTKVMREDIHKFTTEYEKRQFLDRDREKRERGREFRGGLKVTKSTRDTVAIERGEGNPTSPRSETESLKSSNKTSKFVTNFSSKTVNKLEKANRISLPNKQDSTRNRTKSLPHNNRYSSKIVSNENDITHIIHNQITSNNSVIYKFVERGRDNITAINSINTNPHMAPILSKTEDQEPGQDINIDSNTPYIEQSLTNSIRLSSSSGGSENKSRRSSRVLSEMDRLENKRKKYNIYNRDKRRESKNNDNINNKNSNSNNNNNNSSSSGSSSSNSDNNDSDDSDNDNNSENDDSEVSELSGENDTKNNSDIENELEVELMSSDGDSDIEDNNTNTRSKHIKHSIFRQTIKKNEPSHPPPPPPTPNQIIQQNSEQMSDISSQLSHMSNSRIRNRRDNNDKYTTRKYSKSSNKNIKSGQSSRNSSRETYLTISTDSVPEGGRRIEKIIKLSKRANGSFGFNVKKKKSYLKVVKIENGGEADLNGVQRDWRIISIDGVSNTDQMMELLKNRGECSYDVKFELNASTLIQHQKLQREKFVV